MFTLSLRVFFFFSSLRSPLKSWVRLKSRATFRSVFVSLSRHSCFLRRVHRRSLCSATRRTRRVSFHQNRIDHRRVFPAVNPLIDASLNAETKSLLFDRFRLYFANSGLRTRLDLLNTGRAWWTLLVLLILASLAKIIPVTITTKIFTKKPWSYCASMGVLMNTRGIVQLVVLNIGVQLKVLSPVIFAMFVLMATILTFITSPILSILYRKTNEENLTEQEQEQEQDEQKHKSADDPQPRISIQMVNDGFNDENRSSFPSVSRLSSTGSQISATKRHRRMTLF